MLVSAAALSPCKICSNLTLTFCSAVSEVSIYSCSKGSLILLMCFQLSVRPLEKCFWEALKWIPAFPFLSPEIKPRLRPVATKGEGHHHIVSWSTNARIVILFLLSGSDSSENSGSLASRESFELKKENWFKATRSDTESADGSIISNKTATESSCATPELQKLIRKRSVSLMHHLYKLQSFSKQTSQNK